MDNAFEYLEQDIEIAATLLAVLDNKAAARQAMDALRASVHGYAPKLKRQVFLARASGYTSWLLADCPALTAEGIRVVSNSAPQAEQAFLLMAAGMMAMPGPEYFAG